MTIHLRGIQGHHPLPLDQPAYLRQIKIPDHWTQETYHLGSMRDKANISRNALIAVGGAHHSGRERLGAAAGGPYHHTNHWNDALYIVSLSRAQQLRPTILPDTKFVPGLTSVIHCQKWILERRTFVRSTQGLVDLRSTKRTATSARIFRASRRSNLWQRTTSSQESALMMMRGKQSPATNQKFSGLHQ